MDNKKATLLSGLFSLWAGVFLFVWTLSVHVQFSDIADATRQYFQWSRFDMAALTKNWLEFLLGALICLGVFSGALLSGVFTVRLCARPGGSSSTPVVVILGLGLGCVAVCTFGVGLVGLLISPPRWIVGCLAAALAGIAFIRGNPANRFRGFRISLPKIAALDRLLLGMCLVIVLVGLMNIEMSWDALMYHLRLPSYYQYRHKIFDVWHHYYSVYPANIEMLFLLGRMGQGDFAVRLIAAGLGIVFLFSLWDLAETLEVPSASSLLLVAGSPLVLVLMSRSYVDIGLAFFAVLGVREAVGWMRTGNGAAALQAGVFCGFAMGIKYVGILLLPGLVAMLTGPSKRSRWAWGWAGLACGTAVAPWLVKNWIWVGNPVAPFLGSLFGKESLVPAEVTPVPWGHLDVSLGVYLRRMVLGDGGVGGPYQPMVMATIPLALLGPLPSGLSALRRFVLGYSVVWLVLCPDIRFLLPAIAVLAVVVAYRVGTLGQTGDFLMQSPRWLIRAGALLGLLYAGSTEWIFSNPFSLPLGLQTFSGKVQYSLFPVPFHGYLAQHVNQELPAHARIMYLSHFNSYYVERECINDFHFGKSHLTKILDETSGVVELAKHFRQLGVEWLVSTGSLSQQYAQIPGYFTNSEAQWGMLKSLLATRSEAAWQTDGFTLYRLGRAHAPRRIPSLPIFETLEYQRAGVDLASGHFQDAFKKLGLTSSLLADVGSRYFALGQVQEMNGDSNGAAIAYSKAIACGMDTPSVHGGLALALSRTGHPREALPQAEAAWKGHPLSANAAATLAVIASEVGDSVRAKEMVLKAIELRPDKPEYRQLAVQLSISK